MQQRHASAVFVFAEFDFQASGECIGCSNNSRKMTLSWLLIASTIRLCQSAMFAGKTSSRLSLELCGQPQTIKLKIRNFVQSRRFQAEFSSPSRAAATSSCKRHKTVAVLPSKVSSNINALNDDQISAQYVNSANKHSANPNPAEFPRIVRTIDQKDFFGFGRVEQTFSTQMFSHRPKTSRITCKHSHFQILILIIFNVNNRENDKMFFLVSSYKSAEAHPPRIEKSQNLCESLQISAKERSINSFTRFPCVPIIASRLGGLGTARPFHKFFIGVSP